MIFPCATIATPSPGVAPTSNARRTKASIARISAWVCLELGAAVCAMAVAQAPIKIEHNITRVSANETQRARLLLCLDKDRRTFIRPLDLHWNILFFKMCALKRGSCHGICITYSLIVLSLPPH